MMTALNVFAQTNLLNEGFEGDAFPPAGWTTNSSSEWVLDDYLVHGGSQAAYVEYNSDGHNSYLITPQLTLDGNYVLHFYYGDKGFDGRGNYTLGIPEQIIFPEIDIDKVAKINGMDITFVTTAQNDKECLALLKEFGLPFKNQK